MRRARSRDRSATRRFVNVVHGASLFLVTAIFLAGYVARYIHPQYMWWAQLVAIGLPYLSIVLLAWSVVFFLVDRRRWLLPLCVAILVAIRFLPASLQGSEPETPGALKILTYNVPFFEMPKGPETGKGLVAFVGELEPHILGLQETYWKSTEQTSQGRHDLQRLVAETDFTALVPDSGRTFYTEVPVFSRLPVDEVREWNHKYHPDQPDALEVARIVFDWEGRSIAVYNFHLASYGVQKPWHESDRSRLDPRVWRSYLRQYRQAIMRRAWEADQLRQQHLDGEQLPFIVAGDFNATPHNWTYRRIARGLTDTFSKAGSGRGMTYHRRRPLARIDFILISDAFEAESARTVDGRLSDHLGVLASVRWRGPAD